jgi:hypothetical protein
MPHYKTIEGFLTLALLQLRFNYFKNGHKIIVGVFVNATNRLIFAKLYTLLMIIFRYGCLIMRPTRFHIGATFRNENNSL